MGGYGGGEVASQIAVRTIIQNYRKSTINKEKYLDFLIDGIKKIQKIIKSESKNNKDLEWMGCTIVTAILTSNNIYLANVGDSRAYLYTSGNIRQISYDHSLVAEQLRQGIITETEAINHPKKNVLTMSITGRRNEITPYAEIIEWAKGDVILLCSDGLWSRVTNSQMETILSEMLPQQAANKFVTMANLNQGPDNISVLIVTNGQAVLNNKSEHLEVTNPGFEDTK